MFKKGLPIFAFALAALASGVFAQAPTADLDVIVRDFAVDAPGFEEFLSCDAASNPNSTGICFQGNKYMYCSDGGTQLMYDAINCDSGARRGYKNGPDATITGDGTGCWENKAGQPVKVTRGMVGEWLYYEKDRCPEEDIMEDPDGDRDHIKYRYCARPTEGNGNCGSAGNMVGWFRNGGNEKSLKDVITLNRQADGTYQINYDYNTLTDWQNGDGPDNGFFPLDKFDGQGNTWGRQSLNFWCPTAGTTGTTPANICQDWYNAGGPRNHNAAATAATNRGARNKLHNYGFSLAGSGTFKYLQGTNDVFEFIGDDDMWIFIDGQLAADLGGVHLAAPAKLNINELAVARGWEYNSTHSINFFYMDRQTDGSNFKLKMSLSELSASRFGAPTINKTETTIADDNSASTVLYASTELDINDIKDRFVGNTSEYPIIVKLAGGNTICGYRLDAIEYSGNMKAEGQVYKIEGKVICQNGEFDLTTGDSLSFNVNYDQSTTSGYVNPYALKTQVPVYNKSRSRAADMIKMAVNTNKLKPDEFKPEIVDDDPWKPPFPDPDQVFGQGAAGGGAVGFGVGGGPVPGLSNFSPKGGFSSEGKVNSFGTVGNIIPANRTGELVITAYPSGNDPTEMKNIVDGNFFGLPPSANQNNGLYGVADPSKPNKVDGEVTGGYAFVKNGF
ncbi:MAG: fibro-slime domain-containing protein, partial [Fibromonadales bacterium]|nr:fibro-slime domain-containing protein [Fibromonadales bacterium]